MSDMYVCWRHLRLRAGAQPVDEVGANGPDDCAAWQRSQIGHAQPSDVACLPVAPAANVNQFCVMLS